MVHFQLSLRIPIGLFISIQGVTALASQQILAANADTHRAHLPSQQSTLSYWLREPSKALLGHRSTEDLPSYTDVVVVGSGIAGSFGARELVQGGKNVLMLEAREACSGATGRNGGHCRPAIYSTTPPIAHFELDTYNFLKDLVAEHNISCDWHSAGSVISFPNEKQSNSVAQKIEALRKTDPALARKVHHYNSTRDLNRLRLVNMAGAVEQPDAAKLWPYKLVAWVLERLLEAGPDRFNLQTNTPVDSLQKDGEYWLLKTPRGTVRAKDVLLATNAYTSYLLPKMKDLIYPVRAQVAALTPPADAIPLPHTHVWYVGGEGLSSDVYLVQRPDGTLIIGGLRHGAPDGEERIDHDDTVNDIIRDQLHDVCHDALKLRPRRAPEPVTLPSTLDWTGIMGFSKDEMPWVGSVPESLGGGKGLWIAAGFTGHGMPVAATSAMAMAQQIMGHPDGIRLPQEYLITDERIYKHRDLFVA